MARGKFLTSPHEGQFTSSHILPQKMLWERGAGEKCGPPDVVQNFLSKIGHSECSSFPMFPMKEM